MTLLGVADRLLENPTVRQFLLSFDETDWPEVVQSAAVLGIQALIAKYGRGARLTDASLLRALARCVVRTGCWPFSLADAAMEPEDRTPLQPTPGGQWPLPRKLNARGRGARGGRRGGRSVPPAVARVARAVANGAVPAAPSLGSRARGKSAPPDMGPPLKILVNMKKAAPVPPIRLTESNLAAVTAQSKAKDQIGKSSAEVGANDNDSVQGSEWYGRLMSRLHRLNSKIGPDDAQRKPPLQNTDVPSPTSEPDRGLRSAPAALGLSRSQELLRTHLYLDVNEKPPPVLPPAMAREGPTSANQPRTLPATHGNEPAGAPLESQSASMLLSELPSREERRELHAVAFYDGQAG